MILTDFHSFTVNVEKLQKSILTISAKVQVCDLGLNMKMTKTSYFSSIHRTNICKTCLQLNFIIWTDFRSSTVNEDKLQI